MARKHSSKGVRPRPKTVLRLPDLDQAKSAVLNSLSSVDAQRGYRSERLVSDRDLLRMRERLPDSRGFLQRLKAK